MPTPLVTVTHRLRFNAAHRLHNPALSAEENRTLFGRDNNPHGHNYELEVSVTGVIDDRTGYVIDLGELRRSAEDEIISQLDHRHMNMDVPFLRGVNPTSENIVVACWHVLAPRLTPGRLTRLRLHETGNNYVEYDGGDAVGAAIAPTPWRRSKGEGVARPLPTDEPFGLLLASSADADRAEFEMLVRRQLELLGEDPDRDGLQKTPERVAKALAWLTRGHNVDARAVIGDALFEETHESMVMVRDIELYSMCEHHMLPFFGKAHIAYIPNGRIVGLSKLPRIVEAFARRLQVQERLTEQVADAIEEVLRPLGVGVVIEAVHLCMMCAGSRSRTPRPSPARSGDSSVTVR